MTAPAITNIDPRPGTIAQPFFPNAAIAVAASRGFSGIRELEKRRIDERGMPDSFSSCSATPRSRATALR
jgi:hypothetical protein